MRMITIRRILMVGMMRISLFIMQDYNLEERRRKNIGGSDDKDNISYDENDYN